MSAALCRPRGTGFPSSSTGSEPGGRSQSAAPVPPQPTNAQRIGADYARRSPSSTQFRQSPATFLGGANVWHLARARAYVSHQGTSHVMQARQILIATGAMERLDAPAGLDPCRACSVPRGRRPVPQVRHPCCPKGLVVLCGNGPLILQTVRHLKYFGIPIAGRA